MWLVSDGGAQPDCMTDSFWIQLRLDDLNGFRYIFGPYFLALGLEWCGKQVTALLPDFLHFSLKFRIPDEISQILNDIHANFAWQI